MTAGPDVFTWVGSIYLWSPSPESGVGEVAGHGMLDAIIPA